MSMRDRLRSFCDKIKPKDCYSDECDRIVEELFQLLKNYSKFPVSHCVLGGGLPSAKNTSTCLKADADMTVFVSWPGELNSTWIPLKKELVLDDWWKVLFLNTTPDHPEDIIHRTANSLHFYYQGVPIDVLVGFQFSSDPGQHRSRVLAILRVAHRLVQTMCRMEFMAKLIKCLGSELTDAGVKWMREKSKLF